MEELGSSKYKHFKHGVMSCWTRVEQSHISYIIPFYMYLFRIWYQCVMWCLYSSEILEETQAWSGCPFHG